MDLKHRMYHLVMYNISPIQQAIQSYHAGIEYSLKFWNDKDFQKWAKEDKVVIILNGGTSNNDATSEHFGTMQQHKIELENVGIKFGEFYEPDLNNALSAISFLVDERVFDKENYPEFSAITSEYNFKGDNFEEFLESNEAYREALKYRPYIKSQYDEWVQKIGGKKNLFLRNFLSKFRLA